MMKSKNALYNPAFSHIYIEKSVMASDCAQRIISRIPKSKVIEINHYKDVFNKPGQNPEAQKHSQKLILARNTGTKAYPGAPYCHDFGHRVFYYTSQVLNCPFDCSYCYLKGKFPTSNIVVFINTDEYLEELENLPGSRDAFITLSYDSDMAALEPLLSILDTWYSYMKLHSSTTFELRTKSLYKPSCAPLDNLIIAVSLLPQQVIDLYETGTPHLIQRIAHVNALIKGGYRVRLAIDPILDIDDPGKVYGNFINELGSAVDLDRITDVSTGCFRMTSDYYKRMCRGHNGHFIYYYPFETIEKQVRYSKAMEAELLDAVTVPLTRYIDESKIFAR